MSDQGLSLFKWDSTFCLRAEFPIQGCWESAPGRNCIVFHDSASESVLVLLLHSMSLVNSPPQRLKPRLFLGIWQQAGRICETENIVAVISEELATIPVSTIYTILSFCWRSCDYTNWINSIISSRLIFCWV